MEMLNFILAGTIEPGDFTGFTFFIGSVSMLAATVWFLMQHGQVDKKFKDSMLVAALITGIAAVHYFYMREQWVAGLGSPTELRYIDWILTVPLMVVEFALLTGVGMRKLFWASVIMLVTGYFGESGVTGVLDAQTWGAISGLAYFWMAYEVGCLSIFGGRAIYPLGYMAGTEGWYSFVAIDEGAMNIIYNVGDAINKIGFGMAVWYAAK